MGNCCECTTVRSSDNTVENMIRNAINILKIRDIDYQEFHDSIVIEFGLFLTEILNNNKSKLFITKDLYEKYIEKKIINQVAGSDTLKQQRFSCIQYSDDKYLEELEVNYVFSLWALAHLKNNIDSKIEFVLKILKDTEKFITLKTFHRFLLRYLRVNLNIITKNFADCDEIIKDNTLFKDFKALNKLFSTNLLEKYLNKVLDCLKITLKMSNENLNATDLENEFLNDKIISNYFRTNSYLLEIISLRESVYVFTRTILDYTNTE